MKTYGKFVWVFVTVALIIVLVLVFFFVNGLGGGHPSLNNSCVANVGYFCQGGYYLSP